MIPVSTQCAFCDNPAVSWDNWFFNMPCCVNHEENPEYKRH